MRERVMSPESEDADALIELGFAEDGDAEEDFGTDEEAFGLGGGGDCEGGGSGCGRRRLLLGGG